MHAELTARGNVLQQALTETTAISEKRMSELEIATVCIQQKDEKLATLEAGLAKAWTQCKVILV
jgi:hypothetical protein